MIAIFRRNAGGLPCLYRLAAIRATKNHLGGENLTIDWKFAALSIYVSTWLHQISTLLSQCN